MQEKNESSSVSVNKMLVVSSVNRCFFLSHLQGGTGFYKEQKGCHLIGFSSDFGIVTVASSEVPFFFYLAK